MFKNKLVLIIISMLIVITLILSASLLLWNMMNKKDESSDPNEQAKSSVETVKAKELTSAEIKELTFTIKDVTTNLSDKSIFRATFAFELDNKKVLTEFTDLEFKVKSILNQTLADMTREQIQGSKGQDNLKSVLINKITPILTKGKLKQIWITDLIMQ